MEALQAQQNNDEEERRRLEEEQRRDAQRQQEAGPIPVLQKPDTMTKMNAYGAEGSNGIAPERPVAGPQGQRIVYNEDGGQGVHRVGEGMIAQSDDAVFGVSPYTVRKYSAGHNTPDFQDMMYRQMVADEQKRRLDVLREDLAEKEADMRAGQLKESYQDWDPEELSRAYEAKLMREIWAMDPMNRPYPAQYEYEHYHGNGVRDPYTGRVK